MAKKRQSQKHQAKTTTDGTLQLFPVAPPGLGVLIEIERRALELLDTFEQRAGPDKGVVGILVRGEQVRYSAVPEDKVTIFWGLKHVFEFLHETSILWARMRQSPTAEGCDRLVYLSLNLANYVAVCGMVLTDRTFILGANETRRRRKGADVVNADHVELHSLYQAEIDAFMQSGAPTGMSYLKAVEAVKNKLGVSLSTVKSHTQNKWPRVGGRPKKRS